jgi:hypothetical protein
VSKGAAKATTAAPPDTAGITVETEGMPRSARSRCGCSCPTFRADQRGLGRSDLKQDTAGVQQHGRLVAATRDDAIELAARDGRTRQLRDRLSALAPEHLLRVDLDEPRSAVGADREPALELVATVALHLPDRMGHQAHGRHPGGEADHQIRHRR